LSSTLDGSEWSASRSGRFTPRERAPGTHWIHVHVLIVHNASVVHKGSPKSIKEHKRYTEKLLSNLKYSGPQSKRN